MLSMQRPIETVYSTIKNTFNMEVKEAFPEKSSPEKMSEVSATSEWKEQCVQGPRLM